MFNRREFLVASGVGLIGSALAFGGEGKGGIGFDEFLDSLIEVFALDVGDGAQIARHGFAQAMPRLCLFKFGGSLDKL